VAQTIRSVGEGRGGAVGLLFVSAVLWSLGGLLIKGIDWNPLAIACVRSAVAAAFQLLCLRTLRLTLSRDLLIAGVLYALEVVCFITSTKLTTAANAILLQYTAPIYIALLGPRLLGERATLSDWLATAATLGGMVLFFLDDLDFAGLAGNLIAVLSGLIYALLIIFLRRQKVARPADSVVLGNVLVAVCCLPFVFSGSPGGEGFVLLAFMGVFQTGLAYLLYAFAIRRVQAMESTLILMAEPILNPVWVFLAMGERPGGFALIGGAVVLGVVALKAVLAVRRCRLGPA